LVAIVGEALTEDERAIFNSLTGRDSEPLEPVEEFWAVHWTPRRQGALYGRPCGLYRWLRRPSRDAWATRARSFANLGREQGASCTGLQFRLGHFRDSDPNLKGLHESETADTISLGRFG
jgi:hypothetical protein